MQEETLSRQLKSSFDFDCSICHCEVEMPVVTLCGHLFCWGCLCKWGARSSICPVCKTTCSLSSVIPIYSKGVAGAKGTLPKPPPIPKHQPKNNPLGLSYQDSIRLFHMEGLEYRRTVYNRHCFFSKIFYAIMLMFCVVVLLLLE